MSAIGNAARKVLDFIIRAFSTAEHKTNTAVSWVWDNAVEMPSQVRDIGRDFFASFKRIEKKKAPKILFFIGFVSLIVASMYLVKLFGNIPALRNEMSFWKLALSIFVTGFIFGQYIFHVMAVFKLSSGMKVAWASMMRTSCSYIILMFVAESSIMQFLPFHVVTYESWTLMLVMGVVILMMFLGSVREFFTPAYAEPVPIKAWILYILYQDPFKDRLGIEFDGPEDVPS